MAVAVFSRHGCLGIFGVAQRRGGGIKINKPNKRGVCRGVVYSMWVNQCGVVNSGDDDDVMIVTTQWRMVKWRPCVDNDDKQRGEN